MRRSARPLPAADAPAPPPVGDFAYAVDLFHAGRARDAHEEWEVLWRALPRDLDDAWFLKGLLCASAFVVKHLERSPGAPVLWSRTAAAFARSPAGYGLRGEDVLSALRRFEAEGVWPELGGARAAEGA